mgnify:CR=1 FL=1
MTDRYLSLVGRVDTLSDYGMVLKDPNVVTFYLFAVSSLGFMGLLQWVSLVGRSFSHQWISVGEPTCGILVLCDHV